MQMTKSSVGTNFTGRTGTSYTASGEVEYCDIYLATVNGWLPNNQPPLGQFVTATLAAGSAVSLTTATPKTVLSLSVSPGTWDLTGVVDYTVGASTTITLLEAGISLTANTLSAQTGGSGLETDPNTSWAQSSASPGANPVSLAVGPLRYTNSTTGNVTVYLVTQASFATSTLSAYGTLTARPVK